MKKKLLAGLLSALTILSLASCGNSGFSSGEYSPETEDVPNQEIDPEWEAEQEQIYEYGIDLSMYDDHGEWSNGRMWVHRTDSDWDHSEGYYAYIDTEGNVVGEWHSDQSWICPQPFVSDRTLVYLGSDLDDTPMRDSGYCEKAYYAVIDLQGRLINFSRQHKEYVRRLSWSPDNNSGIFASGSDEGTVCLWNADSGEVIKEPLIQLELYGKRITGLAWLENGKYLLISEIFQWCRDLQT